MTKKEWFSSWFDTNYYHILYRHRSYEEAEFFLSNLISFLKIPLKSSILDLGCGKGRHSIFLHKKGMNITGLDLSKESIVFASQFSNENLHFEVGDMRCFNLHQEFDFVFNLFTSFGYFDDNEDNIKVIQNVYNHLKNNGILVFDFLNASNPAIIFEEEKKQTIDDIHFTTSKKIQDAFITKKIVVDDANQILEFEEKVQLISPTQMKNWLETIGFSIQHIFGDYDLSEFNPLTSKRLIIIAKK